MIEYERRDVPGFGGYSVSTDGLIFNQSGRTLRFDKDTRPGKGHLRVDLWRDGKRCRRGVHVLVLAAFVGPRPDGLEVRHIDGNPENNRLSNLEYGTSSENSLDQVRHGRHAYAKRTHCGYGHEFTPENTERRMERKSDGRWINRRRCKKCVAMTSQQRHEIEQIRSDYADDVWTIADLAEIYGWSAGDVAAVVYGPCWSFADDLDFEGIRADDTAI